MEFVRGSDGGSAPPAGGISGWENCPQIYQEKQLDLGGLRSNNGTLGGGDGQELMTAAEREHMFDKVVTPSDVGKLNRLVIPKQHAEKYFPLDSTNNDKGLLLNFEDCAGKCWRFRYSYWNSSQSYVMTKGWSRFVKDKKLDAGDIVSFHRSISHQDRLFIDWCRRPYHQSPSAAASHHFPLLMRPPSHLISNYHPYRYGYGSVIGGSAASGPKYQYPYRQVPVPAAAERVVYSSVPVVQGRAMGKKLRLFGVNMECGEVDHGDVHAITVSGTSQLSSSLHPQLQLRLYNGTPLHLHHHHPNNSTNNVNDNKGKAISNSNSNSSSNPMSLDLDLDLDM